MVIVLQKPQLSPEIEQEFSGLHLSAILYFFASIFLIWLPISGTLIHTTYKLGCFWIPQFGVWLQVLISLYAIYLAIQFRKLCLKYFSPNMLILIHIIIKLSYFILIISLSGAILQTLFIKNCQMSCQEFPYSMMALILNAAIVPALGMIYFILLTVSAAMLMRVSHQVLRRGIFPQNYQRPQQGVIQQVSYQSQSQSVYQQSPQIAYQSPQSPPQPQSQPLQQSAYQPQPIYPAQSIYTAPKAPPERLFQPPVQTSGILGLFINPLRVFSDSSAVSDVGVFPNHLIIASGSTSGMGGGISVGGSGIGGGSGRGDPEPSAPMKLEEVAPPPYMP